MKLEICLRSLGFGAFALLPCFGLLQDQKTSSGAYLAEVQLESSHSNQDFSLDGDLSKPVWKRAKAAEFDHSADGRQHHPELTVRVSSIWTGKNIYFAFSSQYDSLNVYEGESAAKERWQLWERDVVEVFLNPQPERVNHYFEFEVAPNNQWIDLEIDKDKTPFNDASWNSGFEHAVHIDSEHHVWTAEMRIPLASMNAHAQANGQWRVNFFRAAGTGGDQKRKFLAWSIIPGGGTFHVPTRFGVLKLTE